MLNILRIDPSTIKPLQPLTFAIRTGEDATVIIFLTNFGGQEGTYVTNLKQNGAIIATYDIFFFPGQGRVTNFDICEIEPGDYIIEISDWSAEFSSTLWINWWLIAGFASALVLTIWAAWYYGYHKRKHKTT